MPCSNCHSEGAIPADQIASFGGSVDAWASILPNFGQVFSPNLRERAPCLLAEVWPRWGIASP